MSSGRAASFTASEGAPPAKSRQGSSKKVQGFRVLGFQRLGFRFLGLGFWVLAGWGLVGHMEITYTGLRVSRFWVGRE